MTVAAFSISHHDLGLSPLSQAWVHGQDSRIGSPSTCPTSNSRLYKMDLQVPNMMTTTPPTTVPSASFFDSTSPGSLEQIAFPTVSPPLPDQAVASTDRESHHDKRIKVELPTSSTAAAPNAVAVAVAVANAPVSTSAVEGLPPFDEHVDHYGSFEIDYTKLYSQTSHTNFSTGVTPGLGHAAYTKTDRSSVGTGTHMRALVEEDFFDDSAFDHALSEDEDMSDNNQKALEPMPKVDPLPQKEPLPTTSALLSMPPTWDKPPLPPPPPPPPVNMHQASMGMPTGTPRRMDGAMWEAMQQRAGGMFTLTPEERRRLIEIAMGPSALPVYAPPPNRFNFNSMGDGLFWPPVQQVHPPNPISMMFGIGNDPAALRFLSTETPGAFDSSLSATQPGQGLGQRQQQQQQPKMETTPMTADMNAHTASLSKQMLPAEAQAATMTMTTPTTTAGALAAAAAAKTRSADRVAHNDVERKYRTNLRDKISELRNAVPALRQAYDAERSSSTAAHSKVSKGTVLTKAIEYIHQLEQWNRDIMAEHQQLAHRLQAFETLFSNSVCGADWMPSHSMALFDPRGFC